MSEEYNPQAQIIEEIERIEVELKELIRKRDSIEDPAEKNILQQQIDELEAKVKHLQRRLA